MIYLKRSRLRLIGIVFIFLVTIFTVPVVGQDVNSRLTLEDCLTAAYNQNPNFLAYYENLEVFNKKASKALRTMLPEILVLENLSNDVNEAQETYTSQVKFSQTLFQGKKLYSNYQKSKFDKEDARQEVRLQAQTLTRDVKTVWYGLLEAVDLLKESQVSLERLRQHVSNTEHFFKEGRVWNNDVLQAKVKFARGEQSLIKAKNAVILTKSKLNILLHRHVLDSVEPQGLLEFVPHDVALEDVMARALVDRPDLQQAVIDSENFEASVRVAKADFWPKVSLNVDVTRVGSTVDLQGSREITTLQLASTWKIWDWGTTKSGVDAAKAQVRQSDLQVQTLRDVILLEVQDAWLSVREAKDEIRVLDQALEQGEENFRVSTIRYREKQGTANELLDAQDLLTSTREDYIRALAAYQIAIANLDFAMGVDRKM